MSGIPRPRQRNGDYYDDSAPTEPVESLPPLNTEALEAIVRETAVSLGSIKTEVRQVGDSVARVESELRAFKSMAAREFAALKLAGSNQATTLGQLMASFARLERRLGIVEHGHERDSQSNEVVLDLARAHVERERSEAQTERELALVRAERHKAIVRGVLMAIAWVTTGGGAVLLAQCLGG